MPEKESSKGPSRVRPTEQQLSALTEALKIAEVSEEELKKQWQETREHMALFSLLPSPTAVAAVAVERLAPGRSPFWPWPYLDQMYIHASEVLSHFGIRFGPITILPPGTGPGWNIGEVATLPITITNYSRHRVDNLLITLKGTGVKVSSIEVSGTNYTSPNPCKVASLLSNRGCKLFVALEPTEEGTPKIEVSLQGDIVPHGHGDSREWTLPPVAWA